MRLRIILVCLAIMTILAHANELDGLLKDKEMHYVGYCRFDARGILTFTESDTATLLPCVVGATKGEQDLKTILLFDAKGQPDKVLEYSVKEKKQRLLWAKGAI